MPKSDDSLWDVLDDYERQESTGGGLITEVVVEFGYKCYVSGVGNEESWFPFKPGDEAAKNKARDACAKLISDHGAQASTRPNVAVQFRALKSSVQGREVTWQGDRFFAHSIWTDFYKATVKPTLKKLGVTPGKYWGRISFLPDPTGRTETGPDGEVRPKQLGYLSEVYPNKAAAAAAASAGSSGGGASSSGDGMIVPPGYTAETWEGLRDEIAERLGDKPSMSDIASVANDYAATVPAVRSLLGL